MNNKIKGMHLYLCKNCDYHFAIEYGQFPDETKAVACPICGEQHPKRLKDIDFKGDEGFE